MEEFEINDVTSAKSISFLFHLSMWWRILYGTLRLLLGFVLLKLIGTPFTDILSSLMEHELSRGPTDAVFVFLYTLTETHAFTVTYFIAGYFIFWGIVDIVLSTCLLRHVRSAFPVAIVFIATFICYALFRFTYTHSLILAGIILIDVIILYLIYREYVILAEPSETVST